MGTLKIEKHIVKYRVGKPEEKTPEVKPVVEARPSAKVIRMTEEIQRPEMLIGSTYKIKTPVSDHAMYVTINDIVLNSGTEHELRRPFEIFVNSKSMEHFQWIVALTRIMSAVFRKGGDVTFLVDEMKAVFDPRGGYFKAGGVYMPSLVAELGAIVEEHLKSIGMIHDPEMSAHQRAILAEKRAQYENRAKKNSDVSSSPAPAKAGEGRGGVEASHAALNEPASHEDISVTGDGTSFPPSATLCHKCNTKALVIMDGCATCLNCGYSKCG
jgi:hypothetical protein